MESQLELIAILHGRLHILPRYVYGWLSGMSQIAVGATLLFGAGPASLIALTRLLLNK